MSYFRHTRREPDSRLLTIYDLEIEAKWKGNKKDGEEVTGRLSIPEFSHEMIDGLSDYQFLFSVDGSSREADELLAYVRKALPAVLETKLNSFRADLLDAQGMFPDATPSGSGASTPAPRATEPYSPAPPGETRTKTTAPKAAEKVTKTATVEVTAQLQAAADDIWSLLTDANRVPMWSRAAAKIEPVEGTPFELFNGNVSGKIVSVDKPKKLVQTWNTKSPGWPTGELFSVAVLIQITMEL